MTDEARAAPHAEPRGSAPGRSGPGRASDPPARRVETMLAWSEALCDRGVSEYGFYLWRPAETTAVLGLSQNAARELDLAALERDGVAIRRRASGGGAVLLLPGVLGYGAVAPPAALRPQDGIRDAFAALLRPVIDACAGLGLTARLAGISDLAVLDGMGRTRKIAGCAQLRKREAILVHASILVEADLGALRRYLRHPSEEPDYRAGRDHAAFCLNLAEALAQPLPEATAPREGPDPTQVRQADPPGASRSAAASAPTCEPPREPQCEPPCEPPCGGSILTRVVGAMRAAAGAHGWAELAPPAMLTGQAAWEEAAWLERAKYCSAAWTLDRVRPKRPSCMP